MEYCNHDHFLQSWRSPILRRCSSYRLGAEIYSKSCVESEKFRTITGPGQTSSESCVISHALGSIPETFYLVCSRSQLRDFLNTGPCLGRINACNACRQSADRVTRNQVSILFIGQSMPISNQSEEICFQTQSVNYKAGTYR